MPLPNNVCNAQSVVASNCFDDELDDFSGTRYQNAKSPYRNMITMVVANNHNQKGESFGPECKNCTDGVLIFNYNRAKVEVNHGISKQHPGLKMCNEFSNASTCNAAVTAHHDQEKYCTYCNAKPTFASMMMRRTSDEPDA